MRCPKCGKFCKELEVQGDDGRWSVYADCSSCGRTLMEEGIEKSPDVKKGLDAVKALLAVFLVVSICFSGFFYNELIRRDLVLREFQENYLTLYDNYVLLVNTSSTFETYYNELKDSYLVVTKEYSDLSNRYNDLLLVVNFGKSSVLEDERVLKLSVGGNVTLSYDVVYAGYVEVGFNSSTDIYFWVGSSVTNDQYYARYPPFPKTATNGTFIVPVCGKIFVSVYNPSDELDSDVILTINYIY